MAPTVVPPPASARWSSFDCQCCGHPELGSPVFVQLDNGQVLATGSGCAARLVFGERTARTTRMARVAASAAETLERSRQELEARRRQSKAIALEALAAGDWDCPQLQTQRQNWLAQHNPLKGQAGLSLREFLELGLG